MEEASVKVLKEDLSVQSVHHLLVLHLEPLKGLEPYPLGHTLEQCQINALTSIGSAWVVNLLNFGGSLFRYWIISFVSVYTLRVFPTYHTCSNNLAWFNVARSYEHRLDNICAIPVTHWQPQDVTVSWFH